MYFDDSFSTSQQEKRSASTQRNEARASMSLETGELEITSFKQIFIQRPSKKKIKDKKAWHR